MGKNKRVASHLALDAWNEDEEERARRRKEARIVLSIRVEMRTEDSKLTEKQLLNELRKLGDIQHIFDLQFKDEGTTDE